MFALGRAVQRAEGGAADLNPIEMCWGKIKALLRKAAARTVEALNAAPVDVLDSISLEDTRGWFGHCGYKVAP